MDSSGLMYYVQRLQALCYIYCPVAVTVAAQVEYHNLIVRKRQQ